MANNVINVNIQGVWAWFQMNQRAQVRRPPYTWARNMLQRRNERGQFHQLFQELRDGNFVYFFLFITIVVSIGHFLIKYWSSIEEENKTQRIYLKIIAVLFS